MIQITSQNAPRPAGAYSQAVAFGDLVFVSGQVPREAETRLIPDGIEAQTQLVIQNLQAILLAADASLKDIVKVTVHLADLAMFEQFDRTYRGYFSEPFPARTTVGSQLRGVLVEIDAIALRMVRND